MCEINNGNLTKIKEKTEEKEEILLPKPYLVYVF